MIFHFFRLLFWASPAPVFAAAGVVFIVVNINELPGSEHTTKIIKTSIGIIFVRMKGGKARRLYQVIPSTGNTIDVKQGAY